ncbi:MAG: acetyl-CoA carboxylase biotin carboxyl carrier protein subunit [Bacteriovoracaceae bacterium]|jgi:3-methylcrotonyl-CoA carboxylase alpha subunit|nr:acetyl-CoA carboxylase biotin carboxyl carrier protein subunit [Bacteriovoracaceae bacterium]
MNILIDANEYNVNIVSKTDSEITVEYNGQVYTFHNDELNYTSADLGKTGDKQIIFDDVEVAAKVLPKAKGAGSEGGAEGSLVSPMPGKIFKVVNPEGSNVSKGDIVLIMEAMKMEHAIKADKDGKVSKIFFNEGDQVDGGISLCEIE